MGPDITNCFNLAWPVVSKFMQNLSSNIRVILSLVCLLLQWTCLHGYTIVWKFKYASTYF